MSELNYEELILLDNFIYLEWESEKSTIIDIVNGILKGNNLDKLINKEENCIAKMPIDEWIDILEKMKIKPNFKSLKLHNLENTNDGFRAACFIDDELNATVVFRGTSSKEEWDDNGKGAYEYDTKDQEKALFYINNLEFDNITVTGHSKGGNKAQYVSVLSPKIKRCISINGQGFSNEFIKKYSEDIENNKHKIVCINCKYDYVNCLLNTIASQIHYISTEFQINPFFYHKCNILLDKYGNLRGESKRAFFSKIINDFSTSIVSDLPNELRRLVMESLMSLIEIFLCKDMLNENIIKIAGGTLIMLMYGKYFKYKEAFAISYSVLEMLLVPLLLWNDFIDIEEKYSKEKYKKMLSKIVFMENNILNKLHVISDKTEIFTKIKNSNNLIDNNKIINNIQNILNKFTKSLYNDELNM